MKCTVVLMFALCMTVHSYHCGRRSIHTSRIRDSRTIRLQSSSSAALPPSQPVTATTTAVETAARKKRVPKWYSPQGLDGEWRTEVLAGSVVALATIPTSVAYSSIIGLNPLIGIWSSIFVGLLLALVGGGPGVIAGAAGVVAIPMAKLLSVSSPAYMGAAVIAAGLLEILFGISKLVSKFNTLGNKTSFILYILYFIIGKICRRYNRTSDCRLFECFRFVSI